MEEGEAAAAGEQKKKTFPFSRSSRAKPFLGVSIAVSRVSLESSLSREGGLRRKTACRWQAPSPHSKREHGIIFFSPALTTNPFSLSLLFHLSTDAAADAAAAAKAEAAQLLRRYVLDALRASGRADAEAYSQ